MKCLKILAKLRVQLKNDNAFFNEFASHPEPGQSSKSRSDTESDTSIDLEIGTLLTQESEDSAEESPVHVYKKNVKKSDRPSCFKNSRPQVDTVGSQPD